MRIFTTFKKASKTFVLTLILSILVGFLNAQDAMILEFNTELGDGTNVTLPLHGNAVDVIVNWGDGSENTYTTAGNQTHTYAEEGTYIVSITGTLQQFGNGWNSYDNADKQRLHLFSNVCIITI